MPFEHIFFDLDDTLYPASNGLWASIRERMNDYMRYRLHLPDETIPALRQRYFETYGTTLRGLQLHHQVDADDFLAYVHDLPIEEIIQPDAELRQLLRELAPQKWIFTNADANHARRVLDALGISDCFQGIIDIRRMNFVCKPDPQAYQIALRLVGASSPERCIYLDDAMRNLIPARQIGMFTVLVGDDGSHPQSDHAGRFDQLAAAQAPESAHVIIRRPHDLPRLLPELCRQAKATGQNRL